MNRIEIFLLFFSSPSLFLLKQRERKSIISRKCKQNIMKIKQIIKFSSLSKFTSWIDKMQAFDIGVEQNWTWFNNFLFKDNLKNYIHKHIVLVIIFFIIQKFTWKCAANVFSSSKASDWILLSFVIALNSKADECNEHKKNIEMRKKNHWRKSWAGKWKSSFIILKIACVISMCGKRLLLMLKCQISLFTKSNVYQDFINNNLAPSNST